MSILTSFDPLAVHVGCDPVTLYSGDEILRVVCLVVARLDFNA
jgi:hypothetical protein